MFSVSNMFRVTIYSLLLSMLVACQSDTDRSGDIIDDAKRAWRRTTDTIQGYTPSREQISSTAMKQFQDMFTFEYRVIEVDNSVTAEKLQQILSELGQERWECSQVLERGASYMIPCRRRPISLLRYALRFLPFP